MNDNSITPIGNVTREPEARAVGDATVVSFGIAINTRKKEGDEWVDGEPKFYDVKAWRSLGENVADTIQKGMRVIVYGTLDYESWETDGQKRSKHVVQADEVAPSLRWATAQVTKTAGGGGRSNEGGSTKPNPFR